METDEEMEKKNHLISGNGVGSMILWWKEISIAL